MEKVRVSAAVGCCTRHDELPATERDGDFGKVLPCKSGNRV